MTRRRTSAFLCTTLLGSALAAAGCAGTRAYEKEYFILEASRSGGPAPIGKDAPLEVSRFSVAAPFAGQSLIYRLAELEYEADYYREFLVAPGVMIGEQTRRWLTEAGLFQYVLPPGSRVEPAYTLEASVTALYGDFADESTPQAVMEIRFFLLQNASGGESVVFSETYRAATPVPVRTAEAFVAALNQSLIDILTRLEADLRKVLAETGAVATGPNL